MAKKENSAFLEACGSEDKNYFTVRKAVRRRKLRCMLKSILRVLTELFKLELKVAYETKCQISIVNKKNWPVLIKDYVKKNET